MGFEGDDSNFTLAHQNSNLNLNLDSKSVEMRPFEWVLLIIFLSFIIINHIQGPLIIVGGVHS